MDMYTTCEIANSSHWREDKTSSGNLVSKKRVYWLSRISTINKMICIMAKQNPSVILDLHFNEDISIIKKDRKMSATGVHCTKQEKIVTKGKQTNVFQKINT